MLKKIFPSRGGRNFPCGWQRDRLPWFWFFFTVAVLLFSVMDRHHIVSQFKQRERVVIIDPAGTCYLSPLLQFSEARDLHVQQAELATMAYSSLSGGV